MTRSFTSFPVADLQQIKLQMLNWCNRFNICCFLDNHHYNLAHHSIECLVGAGARHTVSSTAGSAFQSLRQFHDKHHDWLFGHFGYDLKNEIEALSSSNPDRVGFPDLFFFVPEYLIKITSTEISIGSFNQDHEKVFREIIAQDTLSSTGLNIGSVIQTRYTKEQYVDVIEKLKLHILRGDCYEINFCQEFFAENVDVDPSQLYHLLSKSSPNPYSAFYKLNHLSLSCMSPERYLKKKKSNILSQPIKGTSRRNDDLIVDKENADHLLNSEKERAENIMVVDLVRNDLSKICSEGTVHVDELCAVYSFPHVHQMISTISGTVREDLHWTELIRATFPMGSMTGAPKKKVMQLIEYYEVTRRGLFSGSVGYITPEGDFDLNVVIRSALYNRNEKYLSFHTGSAITFSSDPEKEFEECLLKAAAIKKALAETNTFH